MLARIKLPVQDEVQVRMHHVCAQRIVDMVKKGIGSGDFQGSSFVFTVGPNGLLVQIEKDGCVLSTHVGAALIKGEAAVHS